MYKYTNILLNNIEMDNMTFNVDTRFVLPISTKWLRTVKDKYILTKCKERL